MMSKEQARILHSALCDASSAVHQRWVEAREHGCSATSELCNELDREATKLSLRAGRVYKDNRLGVLA